MVFAGNKSFGIDSEIGVLSYLSYVQERHMKMVLKQMLMVIMKLVSREQPHEEIHYSFARTDKFI